MESLVKGVSSKEKKQRSSHFLFGSPQRSYSVQESHNKVDQKKLTKKLAKTRSVEQLAKQPINYTICPVVQQRPIDGPVSNAAQPRTEENEDSSDLDSRIKALLLRMEKKEKASDEELLSKINLFINQLKVTPVEEYKNLKEHKINFFNYVHAFIVERYNLLQTFSEEFIQQSIIDINQLIAELKEQVDENLERRILLITFAQATTVPKETIDYWASQLPSWSYLLTAKKKKKIVQFSINISFFLMSIPIKKIINFLKQLAQ